MSNSRRENRLKYGGSPARMFGRSAEFATGVYHTTNHDASGRRPAPVEARNGIPLGPLTKYDHYMRGDEKRWSEAN